MAGKPKPDTAAGRARAFRRDFATPGTAHDVFNAYLAHYPDTDPAAYQSLRLAFQRIYREEGPRPEPKSAAPEPGKVSDETQKGKRVIEVSESNSIRSLEDLLTAASVNRLEWDVERHTVNKWDVTMNGDNGPVVATNWQVKAVLVPNTRLTELTVAEIAKELAPLVKRTGVAFRPKFSEEHANYMLELDIFDLHLGKKADVLETGEHYDLQTACNLYDTAVDTLLARAKGYPIGTVLLPVGNDLYNSDTMIGSTTKGTPQHEDARWQRTFVTGASLIISTINKIRNMGMKVIVALVPGNHCFQNNFFLGQVLQATFSGCSDVEIDCTFPPRKYVQFHDCAIMFTHGSDEKEANLPMLFAQEQPHIWAATRFREVHLAHIHHKKEFKYRTLGENIGLTVRYMRSLSAADAWHYAKGYVGSHRSAEGFVWAKGEGVVAHLTYTYAPVNTLIQAAA